MTFLTVLGQPILILNTQEAAIDLLDKKSAIYSDRPYLAMAGEMYVPFPSFPFSHSPPALTLPIVLTNIRLTE